MTVNFENYTFEIQKTSDGPKLVCITSKKIIEGVIISRKANWYETEALQHTFSRVNCMKLLKLKIRRMRTSQMLSKHRWRILVLNMKAKKNYGKEF